MSSMNKDTTVDIWERIWRCAFSDNKTRGEQHYRLYGKPITGIKNIDAAVPDQIVETYITIDQMVEFHSRGVTIEIINYDDCKKIYECIERHILAWRKNIELSVNICDAPLEDLIAMDEFANSVYDKAKYLIPREFIGSPAIRHLLSKTTLSRATFLREHEKPLRMVTLGGVESNKPERPQISEFFKENLAGFGRWK